MEFASEMVIKASLAGSIRSYVMTTSWDATGPLEQIDAGGVVLSWLQSGVDIYIQRESAGKDKQANWLPAPNGEVYLVMRLYWPKTEDPSILPAGDGTWQPPGVVRVVCLGDSTTFGVWVETPGDLHTIAPCRNPAQQADAAR